ncbi:MAG: class I SAM-dependent methyltransferase [Herminiimonas sp.]|nr:class I SAM-dependent methyltransferase [Herminiimonas sp.]
MQPHAPVGAPSAWVARFASLSPDGEVLDLACGSGRHARLFASLGHPVLAVDRDATALAHLAALGMPDLVTMQIDLESPVPLDVHPDQVSVAWPFPAGRFAAIVVTNYLYRPTLAAIPASLTPGGILIYETFARGNERYGRPSNPDFLLAPGELLHLALQATPPLQVVAFEQGFVDLPSPAMVQRLCAIRLDDAGASVAMLQI